MPEPQSSESLDPSQPWRRLASLAGADLRHTISVAGPHSLDAIVALCRDGYRRVECVRQATCACADDGSDVLLLDGCLETEALGDLVRRTAPLLRDQGVLAVRLNSPRSQRIVTAGLVARGFQILGCAHAAGGRYAAYTVARQQKLQLAS